MGFDFHASHSSCFSSQHSLVYVPKQCRGSILSNISGEQSQAIGGRREKTLHADKNVLRYGTGE